MSSIIHIKTNNALSPKHIEFNKLVASISKLRTELELEEKKLNTYHKHHHDQIMPLKKEYAQKQIALATSLDGLASESKLPGSTKREIKVIICELFDKAFECCIPDQATKDIHDKWAEMAYDDIMEDVMEDQKIDLEDMFSSMGIDIDLDDIDMKDPESEAKMYERLREAKAQYDQNAANAQSKKKKSKKQLEADELAHAKEELKNKSLRSVYLSLAKVLHPDTESDATLKDEKEELMKQVAKAYEEKDLISLLIIESTWFKNTENRLDTITEDMATMYIMLLKDQAKTLRQDKAMLRYQPRFMAIIDIANMKESIGLAYFSREKTKINKCIRDINKDINYIETETRSDVKKYIKIMASRYDNDPFVDIFMSRYFR